MADEGMCRLTFLMCTIITRLQIFIFTFTSRVYYPAGSTDGWEDNKGVCISTFASVKLLDTVKASGKNLEFKSKKIMISCC